jgi:2-methylisocitrate lyase-like PEP mutase family enzyme
MISSPGARFRSAIGPRDVLPCIGVYDVFSATLAAREFDALFVSGFGFAASYYGLPDMGFITWSDIAAFVGRLRTVLPRHHLLVDIDDGYCDVEVACHVVSLLERSGASGVVLEDQRRPRRCGHFDGKQIMDLDEFLVKLDRVLSARTDMVVVARAEIRRRVHAFVAAGADVVLVDGVKDLNLVRDLRAELGHPFAFNQIAGGKSPALALDDLQRAGVSLAIYSTPCLFAAQEAITASLAALKANDGRLPQPSDGHVGVAACTAVLQGNLPSPPAASDPRVRRVS